MAILFDDASSEYLNIVNPIISGPPFTICCWFNVDQLSSANNYVSVSDVSEAAHQHVLYTSGAGNLRAGTRAGGSAVDAEATTPPSVNIWEHACGVWAANNLRSIYLNGGSKGTNTSGRSPTGLDSFDIGVRGDSSPDAYVSGLIAEVGVWNVALTDAEASLLAKGLSPLLIRPNSLIAYYPLHSLYDLTSIVNGDVIKMTAFNSPVSSKDHPPMIIMPQDDLMIGSTFPIIEDQEIPPDAPFWLKRRYVNRILYVR